MIISLFLWDTLETLECLILGEGHNWNFWPAVFQIMDWYVRNDIRPMIARCDDGNPPLRGV